MCGVGGGCKQKLQATSYRTSNNCIQVSHFRSHLGSIDDGTCFYASAFLSDLGNAFLLGGNPCKYESQ